LEQGGYSLNFLQTFFLQISYDLLKELCPNFLQAFLQPSCKHLTNFFSTSYKLPSSFLQTSCELISNFLQAFLQPSCKHLTNFFSTSYKLLTSLLQTSQALLTSFFWTSYKLLTSFLQTSYQHFLNLLP